MVVRTLQGSTREPVDVLSQSINDTQTDIILTHGNELARVGSYIGIGDEIMAIVGREGNTLEVIRGSTFGGRSSSWNASTVMAIGWRWFPGDVLERMVKELRSWPRALFRVRELDVSVGSSSETAFNVALTDFQQVLSLRINRSGSSRWPSVKGHIETNLPTTSFADGAALMLDHPPGSAATVRIEYAAGFSNVDFEFGTHISDLGITSSMRDILEWGTCWRCLSAGEPVRTSMVGQPAPRSGKEVRPMDQARQAMYFKGLRDERISDEIARLQDQWVVGF